MNHRIPIFLAVVFQAMASAHAETAADFQSRYQSEARQADPGFTASAQRGEQFFRRAGSKDWSCATCHTENPAAQGKHATTGKATTGSMLCCGNPPR